MLHKYWGTSALASKLCLLRHFMSAVSCCQVLDGFFEVDQGEAMADIYVWLRYSASRQLTWQRNYNTQPRILSAAQVRGVRWLLQWHLRWYLLHEGPDASIMFDRNEAAAVWTVAVLYQLCPATMAGC